MVGQVDPRGPPPPPSHPGGQILLDGPLMNNRQPQTQRQPQQGQQGQQGQVRQQGQNMQQNQINRVGAAGPGKIIDVRPKVPMTEEKALEKIASYEAYSIRRVVDTVATEAYEREKAARRGISSLFQKRDAPKKPSLTWGLASTSPILFEKDELKQRIKTLDREKSVASKMNGLGENARDQVNRCVTERCTRENDRGFTWTLAQLEKKESTKKNSRGKKYLEALTVYIKRGPNAPVTALQIYSFQENERKNQEAAQKQHQQQQQQQQQQRQMPNGNGRIGPMNPNMRANNNNMRGADDIIHVETGRNGKGVHFNKAKIAKKIKHHDSDSSWSDVDSDTSGSDTDSDSETDFSSNRSRGHDRDRNRNRRRSSSAAHRNRNQGRRYHDLHSFVPDAPRNARAQSYERRSSHFGIPAVESAAAIEAREERAFAAGINVANTINRDQEAARASLGGGLRDRSISYPYSSERSSNAFEDSVRGIRGMSLHEDRLDRIDRPRDSLGSFGRDEYDRYDLRREDLLRRDERRMSQRERDDWDLSVSPRTRMLSAEHIPRVSVTSMSLEDREWARNPMMPRELRYGREFR